MDHVTGGEVLNEAREIREKLALMGGHDRLLAKLDDLLKKSAGIGLHGGEMLKLQNLLKQAKAL
jgi:hypothetical protein